MTDEELVICKLRGMSPETIAFMERWMAMKQCGLERILNMFREMQS